MSAPPFFVQGWSPTANKVFTVQGHLQEAEGTTIFVHACKIQKCQESLLGMIEDLSALGGLVKTDNSACVE